MATNPRQAERETTDVARESTRKAAEEVTHTSRAMAEIGERTARAGADAMRRNAENIGNSWQSGGEFAGRMAERSMGQLSKMFGVGGDGTRQTLQQSSENLQAVMDSTTAVAGALQNVSEEWMRFAQSRAEHTMESFDQLLGCRSLHECLAVQTRIVRDNLEAFLESARRASELSTRAADEGVRKMADSSLAPR